MKRIITIVFLLSFKLVNAQEAGRATADYIDKWVMAVDPTLTLNDSTYYIVDGFWLVPRMGPKLFASDLYKPSDFFSIEATKLTKDSSTSMYGFKRGDILIFVGTLAGQKKDEIKILYTESLATLSNNNSSMPALVIDSLLVDPSVAVTTLKDLKQKKIHKMVYYKHPVPLHQFGSKTKFGLIQIWTKK